MMFGLGNMLRATFGAGEELALACHSGATALHNVAAVAEDESAAWRTRMAIESEGRNVELLHQLEKKLSDSAKEVKAKK